MNLMISCNAHFLCNLQMLERDQQLFSLNKSEIDIFSVIAAKMSHDRGSSCKALLKNVSRTDWYNDNFNLTLAIILPAVFSL